MNKKYVKLQFGKGYYKLIDRLFKEVGAKNIIGIKPKYGRIDIYVSGGEENDRIADKIQELSMITCEDCGEKGEQKEIRGWVTTLCNKCYNKRIKNI